MNKYFFLFAFFTGTLTAALKPVTTDIPAEPTVSVEVALLDALIDVTEKNLVAQKELRKEIQLFEQRKGRFLKDMNNRNAAYDMVQSAHQILENINSNYLLSMFPPEFISELTFFSQIASKQEDPK